MDFTYCDGCCVKSKKDLGSATCDVNLGTNFVQITRFIFIIQF